MNYMISEKIVEWNWNIARTIDHQRSSLYNRNLEKMRNINKE